MSNIFSQRIPESPDDYVDKVSVVIADWLMLATTDGEKAEIIRTVAVKILAKAGMPQSDAEKAKALHKYVRDNLPYVDDPVGIEHMKAPWIIAWDFLKGAVAAEDCETSATFLAALNRSVGLYSTVVLIDAWKTGEFNHAMTGVAIEGLEYLEETTVRGAEFGWHPSYTKIHVVPSPSSDMNNLQTVS